MQLWLTFIFPPSKVSNKKLSDRKKIRLLIWAIFKSSQVFPGVQEFFYICPVASEVLSDDTSDVTGVESERIELLAYRTEEVHCGYCRQQGLKGMMD